MPRSNDRYERESAAREMIIEHTTYDESRWHLSRRIEALPSGSPPASSQRTRSGDLKPPKRWNQRVKIDANINKASEENESSTLRRKGPLENIRDRFGRESTEAKNERYGDLRTAIQGGKLEIAVPPRANQLSWSEENAQRRPGRTQTLRYPAQRPSTSHHTSHRSSSRGQPKERTRSMSEKFGQVIGDSADLLEDGRKGLQSKLASFKPPFSHIPFPSWKKTDELDFACVGDTDSVQEDLGNSGISPWQRTHPGDCRLCRKSGVASVRGHCRECEVEYARPRTPVREAWEDGYENEIRPTPPLKDHRHIYRPPHRSDERLRKDKESIKFSSPKPRGKPIVVVQPGDRSPSQHAEIEDEDHGDDDQFTRWQREGVRPDMVAGRLSEPRDTVFYRFYDEVIGDWQGEEEDVSQRN